MDFSIFLELVLNKSSLLFFTKMYGLLIWSVESKQTEPKWPVMTFYTLNFFHNLEMCNGKPLDGGFPD